MLTEARTPSKVYANSYKPLLPSRSIFVFWTNGLKEEVYMYDNDLFERSVLSGSLPKRDAMSSASTFFQQHFYFAGKTTRLRVSTEEILQLLT
jgi:hypothetical protein